MLEGFSSMTVAGSGGVVGAVATDDALTGSFDMQPFEAVKAGYVIGYSDEPGTTTLYLINSAVSCDEISNFAWLNQLPASTQVIEINFPSAATLGSVVAGSMVSFARGNMFSYSKTRASSHTLVLSQNSASGAVEGMLEATFSSGKVKGTFHADFCATALGF